MHAVGTKVRVPSFTATVVENGAHDGCTQVRDDMGGWSHYLFESSFSGELKLEKVADPDPAYWPPKKGEIWSTGGIEYVVIHYDGYGDAYNVIQPLNRSHGSASAYYSDMKRSSFSSMKSFDDFKKLKPHRVRSRIY